MVRSAPRTPRLTIGVPVYQAQEHIREALDSLLTQTYSDYEVVISDNASTDSTEEICREYVRRDARFRYYRNPQNLGAAANYNRVFELARGHYFKWHAHDDIIAPTFLERCIEVLEREGERVSLCFTDRRLMSYDGELLGPDEVPPKRRAPFDRIGFARLVSLRGTYYPTIVFGVARKQSLRETGLIGAYGGADIPLVAELRLRGEFRQIPERLYFERRRRLGARKSHRGEAAWYDPLRGKRRFLFPNVRFFWEFWRAIGRGPVSPAKKAAYLLAVFVGRAFATIELAFLPALVLARRLWKRGTLLAAASIDTSSLPLRVWAIASGLRRRTLDASLRAAIRPWEQAEPELLAFAAERLARAADAEAARLLQEWNDGSHGRRAEAARVALSRRARQEDLGPGSRG